MAKITIPLGTTSEALPQNMYEMLSGAILKALAKIGTAAESLHEIIVSVHNFHSQKHLGSIKVDFKFFCYEPQILMQTNEKFARDFEYHLPLLPTDVNADKMLRMFQEKFILDVASIWSTYEGLLNKRVEVVKGYLVALDAADMAK